MPSQVQNFTNTAAETGLQMGLAGGMGYLCARLFMSVNPWTAAACCATTYLVRTVTAPLFDDLFAFRGANDASKLLGTTLSFVGSICAGAAITSVFVGPIPIYSAFVLSIMTVALSILMVSAARYCFGNHAG